VVVIDPGPVAGFAAMGRRVPSGVNGGARRLLSRLGFLGLLRLLRFLGRLGLDWSGSYR
jgi:hypothetical protein